MSESAARCSLVGFFCFFAGMGATMTAYNVSTGNHAVVVFHACVAVANIGVAIFWSKA